MILPAFSLVLAWLVSLLLSRWFAGRTGRALPAFLQILDRPNERSLHRQPTPRTGGLALLAGFSLGLVLVLLGDGWPSGEDGQRLAALLIASVVVGLVSFLDDWRDLPRRYRLFAHLLAAVMLLGAGLDGGSAWWPGRAGSPMPAWVLWPMGTLLIVWLINLYNFMDGMDGLAASMAVFGFGALAWLGAVQQAWLFAVLCGLVAASAAGFLQANFPPARIFMGDLGACLLGLFAAGLSLWGASEGLFPLWAAILAFSPFIVDATWTLLRRALRRERFWEPHRSHHYQRLVLAGWSHRRTLLRAWLLMAAAAACAVAGARLSVADQWRLLFGWAVIYLLIHWRVTLAERAAAERA